MSSYKVGEFIGGCLAVAMVIGILVFLLGVGASVGDLLIGLLVFWFIIAFWKAILCVLVGCIGINLYNKKNKKEK